MIFEGAPEDTKNIELTLVLIGEYISDADQLLYTNIKK
jgi:hypothetical protein